MLSFVGLKALRPVLFIAALAICLTACVRYEPVQIRHQWTRDSATTMLDNSLRRDVPGPLKGTVQVNDYGFAHSYVIDATRNGNLVTTQYGFRRIDFSDIESVRMATDDSFWALAILTAGLSGPMPFQDLTVALKPYHRRVALARSENSRTVEVARAARLNCWKAFFPFWLYERRYPYETELYRMGEALQFLVNQQQQGKTR